MKFLILPMILLAFSFQAISQNQVVLDKVVATVGDEVILKSDIQNALAQMDVPENFDRGETECFMLNQILVHHMLLARAKFDSLVVSDDQVEQELDHRIRFFVQQIGSERALEAYYKKSISEIKEEFRGPVREQLMARQMEQRITRNVKITPSEVKKFFNAIPDDSLPYFNEAVEVGQIVRFVRPNQQERDAAFTRLEELRERIINEGNFRTMATLYSDDDASSSRGGDIGERRRVDLDPEFAAATFRLLPDSISPVIETKFGFHIIQLIERRGEVIRARHILIRPQITQEARQLTINKLDSIYKAIVNDTLTFQQAAAIFSEDRQTMNNGGLIFNQHTASSKIPVDQMDKDLFFAIDNLEVGQISQPLPFKYDDMREAYRIVFLKSKTPAHRANLNDDYQAIQEAAIDNKKSQKLDEWLDKNIPRTYIRIDEEYRNCSDIQRWTTTTSQF